MSILEEHGNNIYSDIQKNPDLEKFINEVVGNTDFMKKFYDPLDQPKAPILNDDFSNYFIIAGLPKAQKEKLPKLLEIVIKIFTKKGVTFITQESISVPLDESCVS